MCNVIYLNYYFAIQKKKNDGSGDHGDNIAMIFGVSSKYIFIGYILWMTIWYQNLSHIIYLFNII